jgi:RNA polymerase sigma-70 factor (ECF subfamily)
MDSGLPTSPVFATTHWSVVLTARDEPSQVADAALEKLCRTYWYPLYAFVRRSGFAQHDAEDLTQGFFARLLEKRYLSAVDRNKGRFRSFLLAAFQHFASNQRRDAQAQKRGGHCAFISLNDESAEQEYLRSAPADVSAEKLFARQWATTLLDQVVARLREEFIADGKAASFEQLKIFLTGDKQAGGYAELAARLNTTEAALKMAVRRMRQRYGELLRAEIANTVSNPAEIEDELQALFAALSA